MEENKHKDCHGCLTNNGSTHVSMYKYWKRNNTKCPCSICLIKGVCSDACEEYGKFWARLDVATYDKNEGYRNE